ncbi:hypothetical protein G6F63_016930 [Rhizopus arrhizus]|nr:hypothetical protein G6F63_016930 [Rhizopus arrhizus]
MRAPWPPARIRPATPARIDAASTTDVAHFDFAARVRLGSRRVAAAQFGVVVIAGAPDARHDAGQFGVACTFA